MVKLRLARQGRKKVPIFKIVATDSRSRRDGRYLESLGQYRPSNEPGQKVQIKEDRALYWLGVGAQPSDTVRSLLSGEGILLKWHLEKKKIDPARASEIFTTWKAKRDEKLTASADEKLAAARAREEAKRKAAKKAAEASIPEASVTEAAIPEASITEAAPSADIAEPSAPGAAQEVAQEAPQALGEPASAPVASETVASAPASSETSEPERAAESVEG